jgi:hypothetical protein
MDVKLSIDAIDTRIAALEAELADLRRQRNAFQPICRLPMEILAMVLGRLQLKGNRTLVPPDKTWARTMLVCQHFRDSAVQTPALWTSLDIAYRQYERWTDLCLKRAGNHPLRLYIRSHYGPISLELCHRAHSLEVNFGVGAPHGTGSLDIPMPILRNLEYKAVLMHGALDIGPKFLSGACALLANLDLYNIELSPNVPQMPSLCRLVLVQANMISGLKPLANLLRHAPIIQEVLLSGLRIITGPNGDRYTFINQVHPQLSLPTLQALSISDCSAVVTACMQFLPYPAVSLALSTYDDDANDPDASKARYAQIQSRWLNFVSTRGTPISLNILKPNGFGGGLYQVERGDPVDNFSEFCAGSTSFLSLTSDEAPGPELLEGIDTVHFIEPRPYVRLMDDRWTRVAIGRLRDLRNLVFEGFHTHPYDNDGKWVDPVADIRAFISARGGSIQVVRFVRCKDDMFHFATKLKREGGLSVWWQSREAGSESVELSGDEKRRPGEDPNTLPYESDDDSL